MSLEEERPQSAQVEPDLLARIAAVEGRLDAVEALADGARRLAEAANHLAHVVDPRTVQLMADQRRLEVGLRSVEERLGVGLRSVEERLGVGLRSVEDLETMIGDFQRMAAEIWDRTAISRRIARIEDVLSLPTEPTRGETPQP